MNKSTDASFEQSQLQDEAALEKAVLALSIPGDDITYKTAGLTCDRTITVCFLDGGTVTGEDGSILNKTNAFVTYNYKFTYGGKNYTYIPPAMEVIDGEGNSGLPCGSFTGNNFYFFYYPLYDAKKDELIFDATGVTRTEENPLKLYIAKQTDSSMTDVKLNQAETSYKPVVNVRNTTGSKTFRIYTNLARNLVNESFLESIGKTTVRSEKTGKYPGTEGSGVLSAQWSGGSENTGYL